MSPRLDARRGKPPLDARRGILKASRAVCAPVGSEYGSFLTATVLTRPVCQAKTTKCSTAPARLRNQMIVQLRTVAVISFARSSGAAARIAKVQNM